jgi:DNA-binding transcriptional LysR family regulator
VVETGLGFAILSKATVAKEQKLGELVAIALTPKLLRSLSLVYPKEKFRSRLVNTFVEFAQARMKDTVL